MNRIYPCYASAAFGLEGLVAEELREARMPRVAAENGGVRFEATGEQLFVRNLDTYFSDRLFILLAEGVCTSFEDLFQLVSSVAWEDYLSGDEQINISAKCSRSRLMSPRDCQSITKKAIIERIRRIRGQAVFPESGAAFPVLVSVRNDKVLILLNTSGAALSRRGYRTWNGEAPLRENLAAALVKLSPWQAGQPLHDPCCGTGTILIEAAFRCANRAPGLRRSFAVEELSCFRQLPFQKIRQGTAALVRPDRIRNISGSDLDSAALDLAARHVAQAGLPVDSLPLTEQRLENLMLTQKQGVFICNPPYGERLSDQQACRRLYGELRLLQKRHPGWSLCAISSDPAFEKSFGRRADKKRRLYNGRLECAYYIYSA